MAVVDASVLVEYLGGGDRAATARRRILRSAGSLWAPHLVDAEVGHVLRRAVLAGTLDAGTARAALEDLAQLPLRRAAHVGLIKRAFQLRENVSFYDGLYVALAERLDVPLITSDRRLAGAAGVRATIEVIRPTGT